MSVQCSSGGSDENGRGAASHIAARRRSPGKRTVESLIGGLRSAYPLDDQATTSEVFAEIIGRLRRGDDQPQ
jgi:hypothetical protein